MSNQPHDPTDELEALRTLVDGLRSRLPPMTKRQADDVGVYLLRAVWLGKGEPLSEVLAPVVYDDARPSLRLVTSEIQRLEGATDG